MVINIIKNEIETFTMWGTKTDNSFPGLMAQFVETEHFGLSGKMFLGKLSELTVMLILRGFCGDKFKKGKMVTLMFLQST